MSKLNLDYHVLVYVLEVTMPPSIFILKSFFVETVLAPAEEEESQT